MEQALEKIIENTIRYKENADYLDASIVTIAVTEIKKIYAPIVKSLETEIIDLKKTINTYSTSSKDMSDITKTCEKQRNYSLCDIWENTIKGCASCKFYRSKNKEK